MNGTDPQTATQAHGKNALGRPDDDQRGAAALVALRDMPEGLELADALDAANDEGPVAA